MSEPTIWLSNMRATGHDEATIITPPREIGLDLALEWISKDELVEVAPENVRRHKTAIKKLAREVRGLSRVPLRGR